MNAPYAAMSGDLRGVSTLTAIVEAERQKRPSNRLSSAHREFHAPFSADTPIPFSDRPASSKLDMRAVSLQGRRLYAESKGGYRL